MTTTLNITYRQDMIDAISADFDLRPHNAKALSVLVTKLAGEYDPSIQQTCHMATGAGKTYLMAALIEYLRQQGVYNVMVVTPGLTVQAKTMANFTPGDKKFVAGARVAPVVYSPGTLNATLFGRVADGEEASTVYVFNIQQLIAPKSLDGETKSGGDRATARGLRRDNEAYGNVFAQLQALDDLVVIADESHLYSDKAKAFSSALAELAPAARVGLTASALPEDEVVYHYPLYKAISDGCVKTPVLTFREDGYPEGSDDLQLKDAIKLLDIKADHYARWAKVSGVTPVTPVLMVTCVDTEHARATTELLSGPDFLNDPDAVLRVDSASINDEIRERLDSLDGGDSTVRAVVSVNMLREGWDVKNIAVLCSLRASKSDVLTEQTMGRGLRLPYRFYTGSGHVDQLDIISHESYRKMLKSAEVLNQFGLTGAVRPGKTPVAITPTADDPAPVPEVTPEVTPEEDHPAVGVRSLDQTLAVGHAAPLNVIQRTLAGEGVSFDFPATTRTESYVPTSLATLTSEDITKAAERVSGVAEILEREIIIASQSKGLSTKATRQAEGTSVEIGLDTVTPVLIKAALSSPALVGNAENSARVIKRIVPDFIEAVSVPWNRNSLHSAEVVIEKMITEFLTAASVAIQVESKITPVTLPRTQEVILADGVEVHPLVSSRAEFVRGRMYGPWDQGVFSAASFDAYSTEYRIAELTDKSDSVDWWYRIGSSDGAVIAYTASSNYRPDFVVHDTQEDLYWIVEGKADSGRDTEEVTAKRDAVKHLIGEVRVSEEISQRWAYLLVYESDLDNTRSWDDLKARGEAIRP